MKRLLSLAIAGILFVGSATPAYAAEPNLPNCSIISVEQTSVATIAEVYQEVSRLALIAPSTFYEENAETATVEDFLTLFSYYNRYIRDSADGFVYPAGDSMWMSAAEWADLMSRLDEPISLGEVQRIVERTIECDKLLESHHIPDTVERYKDVQGAFYGEFSDLIENNSEAVKYWVEALCGGVYDPGRFSSLIHETAHEVSARKSGCFSRRGHTADVWEVVWSRKPDTMYPYNAKTDESTKIQLQSVPTSLSIIRPESVPKKVRNTVWYKTYFNTSSAANNYGVYGMLEEFCANTIDIRCDVISSSIKYHFTQGFSEDRLQGYYFWDGAIGSYLSNLREKKPTQYAKLMADEAFLGVLTDISEYVREQMRLVDVKPTDSADVVALREWSEDVGLHLLLDGLVGPAAA